MIHIEDPVFQASIATYLGQPCPLMQPFVDRFFGKNGKLLDKYGANLAVASLLGQGHSSLHNQLQSLLQAMMKLGGIKSEKEALNFLLNRGVTPTSPPMSIMSQATQTPEKLHTPLSLTSMPETFQLVNKQSVVDVAAPMSHAVSVVSRRRSVYLFT